MRRVILAVCLSTAATGNGHADNSVYRQFEGPQLAQGRALWLVNCEGCHGHGIAGAPIPMIPDEWRERLGKQQETLYQHAIEGFFGPDDAMMPPRGGNEQLTDEQVRAAVDYMTTLAQSYIQQSE